MLQSINPLIFIPKVRSIPEVINSWKLLPYHILVVENYPEVTAYQYAKRYCLENSYSHLIICPDDLIINKESFDILKDNMTNLNISNISGITNFSEDNNDILCCKLKQDEWELRCQIPNGIYSSQFTGFACQWIRRDLLPKLSFTGACTGGRGCLDKQFSIDMEDNTVWVNTEASFIHLSKQQRRELRLWRLKHQIRNTNILLYNAGYVN